MEVQVYDLIQKYNNVVQTRALLADTTNLCVEGSRAIGKTTEILAPRMVRMGYSMPHSIILFVTPTYTFAMDTLIPGLTTYLEKHYRRGVHYEINKEPPKHFLRPYAQITSWKNTISLVWGAVFQFGSLDRPESIIGKSVVHICVDELLRIDETDFVERALPTLREDRTIFGNSPFFGGITAMSSTPNFENDTDWWLKWKDNMNQQAIDEILDVSFNVHRKMGELILKENELATTVNNAEAKALEEKILKLRTYIEKWDKRLNYKRREDAYRWYYIKCSSFSNLALLGLDYIKRQLQGSASDFEKFKLSILGIRPNKVREMFFARFAKKHIFKDSYKYLENKEGELIDMQGNFLLGGEYKRTSADLKYCDTLKPLLMGYDPGDFMSCVFAQEKQGTFRALKDFCIWTPKSHFELACEIDTFFKPHKCKQIRLYYDRAGNKRLKQYENNPKGKTDATILKRELEDLGWSVELMNTKQRTIEHWEHYLLLDLLLGERDSRAPKLRFCQFECERLISCIFMSPILREKGSGIQLDKRSEVKLDYDDQQWFSTQLPSALMYLIFGLYEKYRPSKQEETPGLGGL